MSDCRAYEMVTPPYKGGFPVSFRNVRAGEFASSGAPLVSGASLGAFAGGSDQIASGRGNDYAFIRGQAGWEAQPLDPSPRQYVMNPFPTSREGEALAVAESGTALMMLHAPSESIFGSDLYSRDLSGELSLIGPALPPQAVSSEPTGLAYERNLVRFAGASADLSHVLYYIAPTSEGLPEGVSNNLWPSDTTEPTAPSSLYEYAATGSGEPHPVGVYDDGAMIGQCGTSLGGPVFEEDEGNVRGAVSADGNTVFFTVDPQCSGEAEPVAPPAYELFARIDAQRTVPVSEPAPEECEGQCTGASVRNASFQGASHDGSKVFFLSTQKLLANATEDPAEHEYEGSEVPDDAVSGGGCPAATGGAGCNLYEYDTTAPSGSNLTLVSAGSSAGAQVQGVAAVADDGSRVYFVARGALTGANAEGAQPLEGGENLYVFEDDQQTASESLPHGRTTFIATLAESDASQWLADGAAPMDLTPDGRVLVFESEADLTHEGESAAAQVYRYTALTKPEEEQQASGHGAGPLLIRVSIGTEGVAATIPHAHFQAAETPGASDHPAVSSDGEVIAFSSAAVLTAGIGAQSGGAVTYVYEYHAGRVSLISDPSVNTGSARTFYGARLLGVDASGTDIFFETFGELVPQDTDTLQDLYDARSEGGFPAPSQISPCSAGCQSSEVVAPTIQSPATATQPAGPDLPPLKPIVTKRPTRAQTLAKALRACRRKAHKRRRAACEAQARHRYRVAAKIGKRRK